MGKLFIKSLVVSVLLALSIINFAFAQESEGLELVKRRNYKGGADESDLRVQATLPVYKKNNNEANIQEETEEGF